MYKFTKSFLEYLDSKDWVQQYLVDLRKLPLTDEEGNSVTIEELDRFRTASDELAFLIGGLLYAGLEGNTIAGSFDLDSEDVVEKA